MVKEKIKIITLIIINLIVFCFCSETPQKQKHYSRNDIIEYNKRLAKFDSTLIAAYSDTALLNPTPTLDGLWITIHKEGTGELLKNSDEISLKYKISTLLGHIYYTSDADGIKTFHIGTPEEPSGLSDALLKMQHGTEATIILMPDKAFGIIGDENKIVGRQILRYDITIL